MMTKKHLFLFCFVVLTHVLNAVDPLSKIVITSINASCVKDSKQPGSFIFQYRDNVCITFADNSTVTADFLEVAFVSHKDVAQSNKKMKPLQTAQIQNFKRIVLKNNVCIRNAQRKATADMAQIFLADQRCILNGNVEICQFKQNPKDIPVTIQSQKAALNLITGEVKLLGSSLNPVSTTIVLEGHPSLQHKKIKNKKNGKHHQSSSAA